MSNEETKKNVDVNGSLMKHTKAQLVDIILRKDEIEKGLRENLKLAEDNYNKDINNCVNLYNKLLNDYKNLEKKHFILKDDYNSICDEKVTTEINLKCSRNRWRLFTFIILMFFILELIYIVL